MLIDISLPIKNDLPVWPGDPKIDISSISSMDNGDSCNVSYMKMGVHAGTHIDAPHHFMNNHKTIENLNLDLLVGTVYVAEIPGDSEVISDKVLEESSIPEGITRLIIKTKNSNYWKLDNSQFKKEFVAIDKKGAEWIVDKGIRLIGVDYLSVAPYSAGTPTHKVLLGAEVIIVEGLNLLMVEVGYYELICLPIKILGSDGSPARAILKTIETN
jgi:arylformamidase